MTALEDMMKETLSTSARLVADGVKSAGKRLEEAGEAVKAGEYEKAHALAQISQAYCSLAFATMLPPMMTILIEEVTK